MAQLNIRDIGAEQTVARTNTQMMVTCLGVSKKTKHIALYTVLLTLKEPVTGLSLANLLSGEYTVNSVKASDGSNVAPTILDENDPQADLSFTMKEDLNFVRDKAPFGVNRSILNAILNGESFTMPDGDIITVVGTNGTMKSLKARASAKEINLPFKAILGLEADEIKVTGAIDVETGEVRTRKNTFKDAYNTFKKTICLEFLVANGGKQYVDIMATCAINSITKDEGDVNSFQVSGQRLCDVWQRDDWFTEVGTVTKNNDANKELKEIVVDMIQVNEATQNTIEGNLKPIICKVTNKGVISFTGAGATELKGKLTKNTRISARKLNENTTIIENQNCFVVVATANGKDLTEAKAVSFGIEKDGEKNFVCKVFSYERNDEQMKPYVSVDSI